MDMHVRALALALPFVLGIACRTSSTESSSTSGKTAAAEGSSYANDPASGVRAEEGTGTDAGNTASTQSTTTSSAEIAKSNPATSGSSATGSTGTGRDPLMVQDHQPIKAHASDQVLSGTVSSAGSGSISVRSDTGQSKTLRIVAQTSITRDGVDVQGSQIQAGDQVHASFNQVQGDDIAVVIEIVPMATDEPKYPDATGSESGAERPGTDTH
jgi:hypothetical protein